MLNQSECVKYIEYQHADNACRYHYEEYEQYDIGIYGAQSLFLITDFSVHQNPPDT